MKQIKLTPSQHNAIWTCVRYWEANSDDHGLYYMWWALGLGSREDNDFTPEEIESRDQRVMKLIGECLEILNPAYPCGTDFGTLCSIDGEFY